MLTIANRLYETLTKKGLHPWRFLSRSQVDRDLGHNDWSSEDLSTLDPDWLLVEIRHKEI